MSTAPSQIPTLKQVPFFVHLGERQLEDLVAAAEQLSLPADRVVFEEGDAPDGMYVVLQGRARLRRRDADGHALTLADFGVGSFFGELALLEGRPRSAGVVTLEPCVLLRVGQAEFRRCLEGTSADVVVRVLAALSRMVRAATERIWAQEVAREKLHAEMETSRHRALGQMVAGVAHELNTPLGVANTAADLIEKRVRDGALAEHARADPAVQRTFDDVLEASELLRRNVVRAHRLVESFKQVAVREASERVETVDVAEVVEDVLNLFSLNARRACLEIRFEDGRDPSDRSWTGSPSHLTQVLLNLLTNVERYAYPDGVGGTVDIELASVVASGRPAVQLTVRDHGRGIAPEHRAKLFEPFFTTGRHRGGTGLGLAIVHSLVTSAMGGTIRVDSDAGHGTAVTLTLPHRDAGAEPMS